MKKRKMKILLSILIISIITSCSIGKKQVYFNEMSKIPEIELKNVNLIVKTENSKENSALLIYTIRRKIDTEKKEIYLKGYQAAGKKYRNEFEIKLDKKIAADIDNYKVYWIDPDNKRNELKIKNAL
jgi:hypothetical protein